MKVFGHAKVKTIEKTKIGDKEGYKGELAWQMPKANKDATQEYATFPYLIMGKSGENLDKYRNDKNGNARYFLITGDLKQGKNSKYIQISSWDFPPYEPRASDSGGGDSGGGAPMPDEDPW